MDSSKINLMPESRKFEANGSFVLDLSKSESCGFSEILNFEICAGSNVRFEIFAENSQSIAKKIKFIVAENAKLMVAVFVQKVASANIYIIIEMSGASSEADCRIGCFAENNDEISFKTTQLHKNSHCKSSVFCKNVLKNSAVVKFCSDVKIDNGSCENEARQNCANLIMSKNAKTEGLPGLSVFSKNSKVSHGFVSKGIDDLDVFYLASRGLTNDEAKKLLCEGFVFGVFDDFVFGLGSSNSGGLRD